MDIPRVNESHYGVWQLRPDQVHEKWQHREHLEEQEEASHRAQNVSWPEVVQEILQK